MMMSWVAEHEGAVGGERELRAAGRGGERERTISLFTSAWNWNDSARTAGGADAATRSERKSRAGRIFRPATLMADTWHVKIGKLVYGARGDTFVRRGARRRSAPPCTLFLVLCVTRDV